MRKEDLIYALGKLDPEIIEFSDPTDTSRQKVSPIRKGMSKIAVASIVFSCVLVLSGGVVFAMKSIAIKNFFFPDCDKEFEEVYTEVGREYDLGEYKLIFEGSVYEEAVEQGYLSFSVWDKEGNPADCNLNNFEYVWLPAAATVNGNVQAYKFMAGKAKGYFVATYNNGIYSFLKNNNLFIKFARISGDENIDDYNDGKDFRFLILNEEQWKNFYNDIDALDINELCTYTYDKEKDKVIANFDEDSILPEVTDIINKYVPCGVETVSYPTQVIRVGNVKFTIGRADMLMDCNTNDCNLGDFILRREDGTELRFINKVYNNENGRCISWQIEDPEHYNTGFGFGDLKTGRFKYGLNYGFVLGVDEKVTIEANGKIYE